MASGLTGLKLNLKNVHVSSSLSNLRKIPAVHFVIEENNMLAIFKTFSYMEMKYFLYWYVIKVCSKLWI